MKRLVYVLLAIIHQDWWWWDDSETLVFGFVPIGLAFHAGVSFAAACLWALAVAYCWPANVDDDADQPTSAHSSQGGRA